MRNAMWVGGGITGIGGIPMLGTGARGLSTLVKDIFRNGEQGFFYDPNDLSTMYQDAAGTVPVTGVGQPVGLMLDKSKGLILGAELVVNREFDNSSGWVGVEGTVFQVESGKLRSYGATNNFVSRNDCATKIDVFYKVQVSVTSHTSGIPRVRVGGNFFDVKTSVGVHTYYIKAVTTTNLLYIYSGYTGGGGTWEIDSISIKELAGNHAYQTVSASRPILQRNATTGAYYLAFDGSDDFLQTSGIDFTSTDKVSVFAGVRKLSDVTRGVILHTGANTPNPGVLGNFSLEAPSFELKGYSAALPAVTGNIDAKDSNTLAPHSAVISAKYWQGSPSISSAIALKINNVLMPVIGGGSTLQGNFANLPMYIGRRAGTALPFNGHIYSLIGISRLTTDSETIALEKAIAKKTGVTLSV